MIARQRTTTRQPRRSRSAPLIALAIALLALVALLLAAPSALADALSPESQSGSPNAEAIDTLYWIVFIVAIPIFVGVEGLLIYCLVKYRARRRGPEPSQIHGNAPLEIGWTVGAATIVVALAVLTFVMLDDIKNPGRSGPGGLQTAGATEFASINQPAPPGGDGLRIRVNSQQYLFRYDYPGDPPLFSYYELVVPVNTTVVLEVTSSDVAHAWWVPKLGGKVDAIPGHVNETWFNAEKPGVYYGQCAELCGENHADMRTSVRVVPVAEYERWAAEQRREIQAAQEQLARSRQQRERDSQ